MPNTPISLQLPPPSTKGTSSEATMLLTFPDVNATVQGMASLWLLSRQSTDFVSAKDLNYYIARILLVYSAVFFILCSKSDSFPPTVLSCTANT